MSSDFPSQNGEVRQFRPSSQVIEMLCATAKNSEREALAVLSGDMANEVLQSTPGVAVAVNAAAGSQPVHPIVYAARAAQAAAYTQGGSGEALRSLADIVAKYRSAIEGANHTKVEDINIFTSQPASPEKQVMIAIGYLDSTITRYDHIKHLSSLPPPPHVRRMVEEKSEGGIITNIRLE